MNSTPDADPAKPDAAERKPLMRLIVEIPMKVGSLRLLEQRWRPSDRPSLRIERVSASGWVTAVLVHPTHGRAFVRAAMAWGSSCGAR
ncbi:MAG TPA: hypothetical protein VGM06_05565 [Polyangiaceae bacterium]|jgi:hypothetical protein